MGRLVLFSFLTMLFFAPAAALADSELVAKGGPYTVRSNQWQTFQEIIRLNGGEEKVPTVFSFANGGLIQFRVLISNARLSPTSGGTQPGGILVLDQRRLGTSNTVSVDTTGKFSTGNNTLIIQAQGNPGANCSWSLGCLKGASVTSWTKSVQQGGDISFKGSGFGSNTKIKIENLAGRIVSTLDPSSSSTSEELVATIPKTLMPGTYKATVNVKGRDASPVEFSVAVGSTITGTSLKGAVPGHQITIFGTGFSERPAENQATFTTVKGRVSDEPTLVPTPAYDGETGSWTSTAVSSTNDSITVMVPAEILQYIDPFTQILTKVHVRVKGVKADGEVSIILGVKEWN